jgi:hypothetical protein
MNGGKEVENGKGHGSANAWVHARVLYWIISVTVLQFTCPSLISADSTFSESTDVSSSASRRRWSIQFGVVGVPTLATFGGFTVACRKDIGTSSAIGLGVFVTGSVSSFRKVEGEAILTPAGSDSNVNEFSIQISPALHYFPCSEKHVRLLVSIGPDIGYGLAEFWRQEPKCCGGWVRVDEFTKSLWTGLTGHIGAECFVADWLSLFASYGATLRFEYGWKQVRVKSYSSLNRWTERSLDLSSTPVQLGLSVYF